MSELLSSYEQTPYPDLCYAQTHPERLAVIGTLLGLKPAGLAQCRVLELGCASGGNLIPIADTFPGSTCVGVDFAPNQIALGQTMIAALGLSNISLHALDIRDITPDSWLIRWLKSYKLHLEGND